MRLVPDYLWRRFAEAEYVAQITGKLLVTAHACRADWEPSAGNELRMKVLCSEGCDICFHYPACWHAFERLHKADHPEFSFKARTLITPLI